MKILVFTSLFPNNIAPNHGVFVMERMGEVGRLGKCELEVVAPVPYYPSSRFGWRAMYARVAREEVLRGLPVYHPRYFMIPKIGMALQGWTMFFSLLPFVRRLQRKFDFDLIDAHYIYPDGFAASLLGVVFKKPVVVSARGSDINQFIEFPLIRRMLLYVLKSAACSIAVCQALKDVISDLGVPSSTISVIPNGVDTSKFFPTAVEKAREELGLPLNRKVVVSVGALIPRKGHDYTIRALKGLIQKPELTETLLLLIGSGPERRELESLARSLELEKHVRFVGEIPHNQLHLWYSAADVFCLSSDREGWPNAVMESLACGTPVVATDIWGNPEIIQSESIGILTKRDERQIADALLKALTMTWNRETIVEFARQYTWQRAAESVQVVFESVLKISPRVEDANGIKNETCSSKRQAT